ncbi:MAG TPA: aminotransferase class V-fold PLP-dependent enzyme [Candidatus Kryptonia bacterium]|nr:aminotransferase class V-fold PLP-dependent enzyme [Candidatus Kryptonia bacterium]
MQIERWRREFRDCEEIIHLNHAGASPVPTRVVRAVTSLIEQATRSAPGGHIAREQSMEATRSGFARLIGAASQEIAFVTNTSHGLSLIATAMPWRAGDNVVAIEGDYPANVYPWWGQRRFGVETRMVPPRNRRFGVDAIRAAVDARTRVIAVSAVDWQTGFRCDLGALGSFCRERGVLFCVDGIQAVGALEVNVERDGVDCLAAGGHKWLLAPHGCGALYVSPRIVEQMQPVVLGWNSVVDPESFLPYHFDLRSDAARFEPGTHPYLGIAALGAAIELLHEVGVAAIEARVLDLTAQLAEGLRERGAEILSPWGRRERSGILTVRLGDGPDRLVAALQAHNIICRVRAGGVRLAPHFYLSTGDVTRFFTVLDDIRRQMETAARTR